MRLTPLPVVAKWLGNTPAIAMRPYVEPTDADFEGAVNANLTRTGGTNAGAADARKARQGMEAADSAAQENGPQPRALQQVGGICDVFAE